MGEQGYKRFAKIAKSTAFQTILYLTIIIVMTNLNALVDFFLHPEIPYFDKEHLIVGGITGFVSIVLFGLLFIYMRHLNDALDTITTLESILPICSNCKKIRKTDSDPEQMDSWQPIESYITQMTTTKFSHGICPECLSKLYPEYTDIKMNQNDVT
jgi:cadmium resistance protein CadD (predicted permease)